MDRSAQKVGTLRQGIPLTLVVLLLAGCGSTKETSEGTSLKEYEATFRPSDFDQPLQELLPRAQGAAAKDSSAAIALPVLPPELTQGYRVQIFATTSYDEAMSVKAAADSMFTDQWFYVVYDPPTYKVRAGNFLERYEADRFAKLLSEKGYNDSWVVPEKVFSNPPPRPALDAEVPKK